jgi:hypothetical protein
MRAAQRPEEEERNQTPADDDAGRPGAPAAIAEKKPREPTGTDRDSTYMQGEDWTTS